MRTSIFIAFLGLALTAQAEDLNIKGAKIGMSADQVHAALGDPFKCSAHDHAKKPMNGSFVDLIDSECWRDLPWKPGGSETYGGQSVSISYHFRANKLVEVYISGLKPNSFESVQSALLEKFGKPLSVEHEDVQTGFGAKFTNITAHWQADDAILTYAKYCGQIDLSCFTMDSLRYEADFVSAQRRNAKKDM